MEVINCGLLQHVCDLLWYILPVLSTFLLSLSKPQNDTYWFLLYFNDIREEVPAYMSPFQASLLRRITCAILWLTFEGKEKISEKSTTKYHLNLSRILKKAIIQ